MKHKITLILAALVLISLAYFYIASSQYAPAKISITSDSPSWTVTKSTGEESQLTFWTLNGKDKKTELGWIPPNNSCIGWTDKYLYDETGRILDDKNKDIMVKCESAKCGGRNCYHISLTDIQAINIDDYVRLGENSVVVEYQETKTVTYQDGLFNLTATLFMEINGDWNNTVNNIFVREGKKNKFWANVTDINFTPKFKYQIIPSEPITNSHDNIFFFGKHYLDVNDICRNVEYYSCMDKDTDNETCTLNRTFYPDCKTTIENNNLEIIFSREWNDTILIDPSVGSTEGINVSGLVAYGQGTDEGIIFRNWTGMDFAGEQNVSGLPTGNIVEWVRVESCPTRNETAIGAMGDDGNIVIFIRNDTSGEWTTKEAGDVDSFDNFRGFDIAYEQNSGDLLVVNDHQQLTDSIIHYWTWNGTWSTQNNYTFTTSVVETNRRFSTLVERKDSNEILFIGTSYNVGGYITAMLWNGTGFQYENAVSGLNAIATLRENYAAAWEYGTGRAVTMTSINNTNSFTYWILNESRSWNYGGNVSVGGVVTEARACSDDSSNHIGVITQDSAADVNVFMWNGSDWITTIGEDASTENPIGTGNIDCEFGKGSGIGLFAFGSVLNANNLGWLAYNRSANNWYCPDNYTVITDLDAACQFMGLADDPQYVKISGAPVGDNMMITSVILSTGEVDVEMIEWNGINISQPATAELETAVSSSSFGSADFAYQIFDSKPQQPPVTQNNYTANVPLSVSPASSSGDKGAFSRQITQKVNASQNESKKGNFKRNLYQNGTVGNADKKIYSGIRNIKQAVSSSAISFFKGVYFRVSKVTTTILSFVKDRFSGIRRLEQSVNVNSQETDMGFFRRAFDFSVNILLYLISPLQGQDTTPPWFEDIPASFEIPYGTDLSAWGGVFYANDDSSFSKFGVNDSLFTIRTEYVKLGEGFWAWAGYLGNATVIPVGVYHLNISINDTAGNYNFTLFNVNVTNAQANYTVNSTMGISLYSNQTRFRGGYIREQDNGISLFHPIKTTAFIWKKITQNVIVSSISGRFRDIRTGVSTVMTITANKIGTDGDYKRGISQRINATALLISPGLNVTIPEVAINRIWHIYPYVENTVPYVQHHNTLKFY